MRASAEMAPVKGSANPVSVGKPAASAEVAGATHSASQRSAVARTTPLHFGAGKRSNERKRKRGWGILWHSAHVASPSPPMMLLSHRCGCSSKFLGGRAHASSRRRRRRYRWRAEARAHVLPCLRQGGVTASGDGWFRDSKADWKATSRRPKAAAIAARSRSLPCTRPITPIVCATP